MPKVIRVDNFNRENVSDYLIEENLSQEEADKLCESLRGKCNEHSSNWYEVKPDDYVLYKFEP